MSGNAGHFTPGDPRTGPAKPFTKGVSGNPGGRPKAIKEIVDLCRELTVPGLMRMKAILEDDEAPPAAQVAAFREVMDRAWGKAPQVVTGADDGPVQVVMKIITGVPRDDD